jgi:hypothetical protein
MYLLSTATREQIAAWFIFLGARHRQLQPSPPDVASNRAPEKAVDSQQDARQTCDSPIRRIRQGANGAEKSALARSGICRGEDAVIATAGRGLGKAMLRSRDYRRL